MIERDSTLSIVLYELKFMPLYWIVRSGKISPLSGVARPYPRETAEILFFFASSESKSPIFFQNVGAVGMTFRL